MKYGVILLAAGSGKRMALGYNKLFLTLHDIPIIVLSLHTFYYDSNCQQIVLVCQEHEQDTIKQILSQYHFDLGRITFVAGGAERQYSVYNGLKAIETELVLIHDAARPFITPALISELVKAAQEHGCAIPGVPVKDTIKLVHDHFVSKTLPRESLYAIQTPQAVQTSIINQAHYLAESNHFLGTDDASLIEQYQLAPVKLVLSSYDNIKITTKEDLLLAQQLFSTYFNKEAFQCS